MTTNPFIVDVVGTSVESFQRYIEFVSKVTDAPIQIDAISPKLRMEAVKWAAEVGLSSRIVNNSIYKGVKDKELDNLKECGVKASIVLCDNPTDDTVAGKISALEAALPLAEQAGIEGMLIDTSMSAWGIGVGAGLMAIKVIKEKYGDIGGRRNWNRKTFLTHSDGLKATSLNRSRKQLMQHKTQFCQ